MAASYPTLAAPQANFIRPLSKEWKLNPLIFPTLENIMENFPRLGNLSSAVPFPVAAAKGFA